MSEITYPAIEQEVTHEALFASFTTMIRAKNPHAQASDITQIFDHFIARYSEPHRRHHTLTHIQELLAFVEMLGEDIQDPEIIQLAIWEHDIVHDTRATQPGINEEHSAVTGTDLYTQVGIPAPILAIVEHYTRATITHDADEIDQDLLLFLDMDMAILGAPWERYFHYAQAIREEYGWVDSALYGNRRIGFLNSTLQRPIFKSALFAHFEEQARENMAKEIEWLESLDSAGAMP